MARPPAIKTTTVTFGPGTTMVLGTDLAMEVQFVPSTAAVWEATGTPLLNILESATAEVGMEGSAVIPNPDQDGFIDGNGNTVRNWTYRATAKYLLGGSVVGTGSKVFTLTADQIDQTVDLDTLIPVTSSAGVVVAIPDTWTQAVSDAQAAAAEAAAAAASAEPAGLSDETKEALATDVSDTGTPIGAALSDTIVALSNGLEPLVSKLDHAEPVTIAAFGDSTFAGRAGTWIPRVVRNLPAYWPHHNIDLLAWSDITEAGYYSRQIIAQGRGNESSGDDFTYTADINTHAPSIAGGAWSGPPGVWLADGAGAVAASASSSRIRCDGSTAGDRRFTMHLSFVAQAADSAKFIAITPCCTDDSNELEVRLTFGTSGSPALALYTRVAGTLTQIGTNQPISSIAAPSASVQDLSVNVEIAGTTVTVSIADTTAVYTLPSGDATAVAAMTKIGFRSTLAGVRVISVRSVSTATADPLLTMLNNSKAGTTLSYQTSKMALMMGTLPDVAIIGSSHNEGTQTADAHLAELGTFIATLRTYAPGLPIILVGQNPEFPPAGNAVAHAARTRAIREYARKNGYGYIGLFENFVSQIDGGKSLIGTDGIHPTGPNSTDIQNLSTGYEFAAKRAVKALVAVSAVTA